ncbi:MAG: hypothetical protein M1840_000220 [Geoglossum simile]|nr:MAG: hypothetical protein M1840_000220 [Geoglossum simile]
MTDEGELEQIQGGLHMDESLDSLQPEELDFLPAPIKTRPLDLGELIPKIGHALPVFSLGPPAKIPSKFVHSSSPNTIFKNDSSTHSQLGYDGDVLVSFVHGTTGGAVVFHNLTALKPASEQINIGLAYEYIKIKEMFPEDHTKFAVVNGSSLQGHSYVRGKELTPPATYLKHGVVQRKITVAKGKDMPVCGPGSQASFGFGRDGQVYSVSYRWKSARSTKTKIKARLPKEIYEDICKQLEQSAGTGLVRVDGVDVCFYDSGNHYIRPVYRFWATLNVDRPKPNNTAPMRISGYVPIGKSSPEAVPALNDKVKGHKPKNSSGQLSTQEAQLSQKQVTNPLYRTAGPSLTLGRYIVRDDTDQWYKNSNAYLAQLRNPFGFSLLTVASFVDSQYYWAEPWFFTSERDSFINSVHIAENEVHGNWHWFSTEKNCCDGVTLDTDIPPQGYGPNSAEGVKLAYWIIHSCEVIPTPTDYSPPDQHKAYDPWWTTSNGIHAVLGYRTDMWIGDSVMSTFGAFVALGAPVVPTWLGTVSGDTGDYHAFWGNDQMYFDKNRQMNEPMGRASAVLVTGHEGDRIVDVQGLGRPGSLTMWWYDN